MTPQQIRLVTTSFGRIFAARRSVGVIFYEILFDAAPGVRPLFVSPAVHQHQKFDDMISMIVSNISRPERLVPSLELLARRHRGYGAQIAHFDIVGAALLEALERATPKGLSEPEREAWAAAFGAIRAIMEPQMLGTIDPADLPEDLRISE